MVVKDQLDNLIEHEVMEFTAIVRAGDHADQGKIVSKKSLIFVKGEVGVNESANLVSLFDMVRI